MNDSIDVEIDIEKTGMRSRSTGNNGYSCRNSRAHEKESDHGEQDRAGDDHPYRQFVRSPFDQAYDQEKCHCIENAAGNVETASPDAYRVYRQEFITERQCRDADWDIDCEKPGQFATDRMAAATVGPAAAETETTNALIPIPLARNRDG